MILSQPDVEDLDWKENVLAIFTITIKKEIDNKSNPRRKPRIS